MYLHLPKEVLDGDNDCIIFTNTGIFNAEAILVGAAKRFPDEHQIAALQRKLGETIDTARRAGHSLEDTVVAVSEEELDVLYEFDIWGHYAQWPNEDELDFIATTASIGGPRD